MIISSLLQNTESLNETQDALYSTRNLFLKPRLLPGPLKRLKLHWHCPRRSMGHKILLSRRTEVKHASYSVNESGEIVQGLREPLHVFKATVKTPILLLRIDIDDIISVSKRRRDKPTHLYRFPSLNPIYR